MPQTHQMGVRINRAGTRAPNISVKVCNPGIRAANYPFRTVLPKFPSSVSTLISFPPVRLSGWNLLEFYLHSSRTLEATSRLILINSHPILFARLSRYEREVFFR